MKNLITLIISLVMLVLVGCVLDTENSNNQNKNDTAQVVIQHQVTGTVAECRNDAVCDTSEASAIYHLSLDDNEFIEVNRATYNKCRNDGDFLRYPACLVN